MSKVSKAIGLDKHPETRHALDAVIRQLVKTAIENQRHTAKAIATNEGLSLHGIDKIIDGILESVDPASDPVPIT